MISTVTYYENKRISSNPYGWRLKMVLKVQEIGIKPTVDEFKTTRRTVKKWYRRYLEKRLDGLLDQSRKPELPRTIPKEDEERIVALRKRRKNLISCWAIKILPLRRIVFGQNPE